MLSRSARGAALLLLLAGPARADLADDCQDAGIPAAERLAICEQAHRFGGAPFHRAPALLGRARAHQELGDLDAAMVDAMAAEREQPDWAEPALEQGRIRVLQGRGDEALAQAQRAVGLAAGDVYVLLAAMEVMADAGHAEACLALAPEAERMAPEDPLLFAVRGRCLAGAGDFDGAVGHYRRAVALGQDTGFNHAGIAHAELRAGRPQAAAAAARRALSLDPTLGTALRHLVVGLLDAGDAEAAMAAWRKGFPGVRSDLGYAANGIAWRLYLAGRSEEGMEVFEDGFGEDPWLQDPNQIDTYGHLLASLGMPDVAAMQFDRAYELGGPELRALYERRLTEFGFPPGDNPRGALLACARRVPACRLHD